MDSKDKFTGKADIYAKARPNYPQEYLDYLIDTNELTKNSKVADIGSGTGILTKQLLELGFSVAAVEPNADMRGIAERNLADYSNFISVNASAEETGLFENAFDLITVAQAFHWFDVSKFKVECSRILKPHKKVSLVWNSRDTDSVFVQKNMEMCRHFLPNFVGFSGGIEHAPERYEAVFKDGVYEYKQFENPIVYTLEDFIRRNLSVSYSLKQGEDGFEQFIEALTALFYQYAREELLCYPNITQSYMGEV